MGGSGLLGSDGVLLRLISVMLIVNALALSLLVTGQILFNPFHVVASDSMAPEIQTGDAVVMGDVDARSVEVGEVIVFLDPVEKDSYIIHRVVNVESIGETPVYTTKGDNNPVADPKKVSPGMIVGSMSYNIPRAGYFLEYLSSFPGYLLCVVIPAALAFTIAFGLAVLEKARIALNRKRIARALPGLSFSDIKALFG